MPFLRRIVLALPVALLVSAAALAVFFASDGRAEAALRVHEWALSVALMLLTLVGVRSAEGTEWRALRVRSEQHVYLVVNLALLALAVGSALQILYAWALHGRPLNLDGDEVMGLLESGVFIALLPNWATFASIRLYGFEPGPVWRSGRGYAGKGQPWGCTINAVMFALLALGAAWVPFPFLVPGLLLVAYGVLLARAGILAAPAPL